MTYTLAKKLKDAGFPFDWNQQELEFPHSNIYPTLEELIEACGERFYALIKSDEGWYAHEKNGGVGIYGKTPSEAVANLWLELNK